MSETVKPDRLYLEEDKAMPNNPAWPVLVYRGVLSEDAGDHEQEFRRRFGENGWRGLWTDGIFDYHHFHPDAHEALGIAAGEVKVQLGGDSGRSVILKAGDMVILPAGTGHKRLSDKDGLKVVGAYPPGQEDYSLCRDKSEMNIDREALRDVPRQDTDPFYGSDGPVNICWS